MILLERRKELWAEGFSLFDLLRNQKSLVREGDHQSLKNFPANSWKFIFRFHEANWMSTKVFCPKIKIPIRGYTPIKLIDIQEINYKTTEPNLKNYESYISIFKLPGLLEFDGMRQRF